MTPRKVPTFTGPCVVCSKLFTGHYARRICDACRPGAYQLGSTANAKVQQAVRAGRLPDLRKVSMPCVDCGQRARLWEHRDYAKALEVVPTCTSCNIRRGPGARSQGIEGVRVIPAIHRTLKKEKAKRSGRPKMEGRRVAIILTEQEIAFALEVGNGNVSEGIRRILEAAPDSSA